MIAENSLNETLSRLLPHRHESTVTDIYVNTQDWNDALGTRNLGAHIWLHNRIVYHLFADSELEPGEYRVVTEAHEYTQPDDVPSAETVSPMQEVFGGLRGARSRLMVAPTGEVVQETDVFW